MFARVDVGNFIDGGEIAYDSDSDPSDSDDDSETADSCRFVPKDFVDPLGLPVCGK